MYKASERTAKHDKQTKLQFLISVNNACSYSLKNFGELKQIEHMTFYEVFPLHIIILLVLTDRVLFGFIYSQRQIIEII